MSSTHLRKYGESATIPFELFEVDGINFRVDAVYAAGDVKIMKDEGAEANTTNSFTDEGTGYSIVLTATEMQAARIVLYFVDQTATKVWLDRTIVIETYGHASAQHAFDLDTASVAQTGDSYARLGAPAGASIAADLVVIDNFVDELESRLTAIRAGYLDELAAVNIPADIDTLLTRLSAARAGYLDNLSAGAVALASELAKVPKSDGAVTFNSTALASINAQADTALSDFFVSAAKLVDDIYDEAMSGHNVGGSFGQGIRQIKEATIAATGSVNDASATTTTFITTLLGPEVYKDASLVMIDAPLAGESKPIISHNIGTGEVVVGEAFSSAPPNGMTLNIKTDHIHPIAQIQSGLATEAKQDIIDANVDAIQTTLGVAGAGLTDLGGMSTAMKAEVLVEVVKLLTTQMTESYAADGVAPTPTQALMLIQQALTEFAIVATALTVKKLDGTTTAAVMTLDSATAPTSTTRTT